MTHDTNDTQTNDTNNDNDRVSALTDTAMRVLGTTSTKTKLKVGVLAIGIGFVIANQNNGIVRGIEQPVTEKADTSNVLVEDSFGQHTVVPAVQNVQRTDTPAVDATTDVDESEDAQPVNEEETAVINEERMEVVIAPAPSATESLAVSSAVQGKQSVQVTAIEGSASSTTSTPNKNSTVVTLTASDDSNDGREGTKQAQVIKMGDDAPNGPDDDITVDESEAEKEARLKSEAIDALNAYRASIGARTLKSDACMMQNTQAYAEKIASEQSTSHSSADMFPSCKWNVENILAYDLENGADAIDFWRTSTRHDNNMKFSTLGNFGMGVAMNGSRAYVVFQAQYIEPVTVDFHYHKGDYSLFERAPVCGSAAVWAEDIPNVYVYNALASKVVEWKVVKGRLGDNTNDDTAGMQVYDSGTIAAGSDFRYGAMNTRFTPGEYTVVCKYSDGEEVSKAQMPVM